MKTPPARKKQNGRCCRHTAAEIERVRELYRRWYMVRRERNALCDELGIRPDQFNRYGMGIIGIKPRPDPDAEPCAPAE